MLAMVSSNSRFVVCLFFHMRYSNQFFNSELIIPSVPIFNGIILREHAHII